VKGKVVVGVATVLLIGVLAAAAGGGHSGRRTPTATTVPTDRAAFTFAANAICRQFDTQAAAAAPSGNDLASYAASLGSLIPLIDGARTDLAKLNPPSDGAAMLRAYVAFLGREVNSATAARAAAAAGDQQAFTAAMEGLLTGQEQPAGALPPEMLAASKYGLTDCAR